MPKKYAPARIQNPSSLHQVVKVRPGQDVLLYLDDEAYGKQKIEVSCDRLKIEPQERQGGKSCYRIVHSEDVHEWADYSTSLLGEVWIDGEKAIGKVGVLLETGCAEKSHIRTVVNPDCVDLRVYPYNIIEVIVYDLRFGYHDEWHCEWRPLVGGLGLDQIGYDHLCLHSWQSYYSGLEPKNYLYARFPRVESAMNGMLTRQHHFWFRFDAKIFTLMAQESSVVCVGNIVASGISNRFQLQYAEKSAFHLSLYVDFRKKPYQQTQITLNLKTRGDSTPVVSGLLSHRPDVAPAKKVLPSIRDIDIKLVELPGEITGCHTLPTLNESYNVQTSWSDYDDYYDVDVPRQHFSHLHNHHHRRHPQHWRKWE